MISSLVEYLEELIGVDMSFSALYHQVGGSGAYGSSYVWDYGAMLEFVAGVLLVLLVVRFALGFLRALFLGK